MSEVPVWNCEFAALKDEGGAALDALTVGAKFTWKCHGDLSVAWSTEPVSLSFAKPEDEYTLAVLQVIRQEPNDVQYLVTTYKAGEHAPDYIRVLQGKGGADEKGFEVVHPKWQTKSVLDPKQPGQPVPPFGPWNLRLPVWFTVGIVILLAILIYGVVRRVRKYRQRRRMLEDLKRHKTALVPLHQFYRDARQLRRRLHNVKEPTDLKGITEDLDREFRLLILRQFQIPSLDWSDRDILEDLRKRHRKTYKAAAESLKRTLRELTKLKARAQVGLDDVEQLHRMSLDTAERLQTSGGPR